MRFLPGGLPRVAHRARRRGPTRGDDAGRSWGTVLETWEGFSMDEEIRYRGSSAGLATAIGLYCVEKAGMHGVLHIGADPDAPVRNRTFLSVDRAGLLGRTGSRYSPASPCDGLGRIETAPAPCVFVGKPCDVAGLRKAQSLRETLDRRVGIAIGIFCAGTPSTGGPSISSASRGSNRARSRKSGTGAKGGPAWRRCAGQGRNPPPSG